MLRFKPLFLIIGLFLVFNTTGQETKIAHYNGLNFEENQINVGIRNLTFSKDGQLWIGTTNGVVQFNGYRYKYFKDNVLDSSNFTGYQTYAILEDQEGGIWAGVDHGINYLHKDSLNFIHFHYNVDRITSIAEDSESNLWLANSRNIISFDKVKRKFASYKNKNSDHRFGKLFFSKENELICTGFGLHQIKIDGDGINLVSLAQVKFSKDIEQHNDGTIIVSVDSGFLFRKPSKLFEYRKVNIRHTANSLIHLDKSGNIWFGFSYDLVQVKIDKDFNPIQTKNFGIGNISDITEDQSGNLFIGSNGRFLKLGWNYENYKFIKLPGSFNEAYAFKFLEDSKGKIWVGTSNGLQIYDQQKGSFDERSANKFNRVIEDFDNKGVYSIHEDLSNNVWLGTSRGLIKYDPILENYSLVAKDRLTHHITNDINGNIWCVIGPNLNLIKQGSSQVELVEVQDANINTDQIFIDRDNCLWIWHGKLGLVKYDISDTKPKQVSLIKLSLENNQHGVNWIEEDNLGRLWVSKSIGVYVIDKKSNSIIRFFNTKNSPLRQDDVFEIIKDSHGFIWLKQARFGSVSLDPKDFTASAFNPTWVYGGASSSSRRGPACVAASGKDGKLIADGWGDFCIFYKDSLQINRNPPILSLDEFIVNGKYLLKNKLTADENNAIIKFNACHFDNPLRNQSSYWLKGYDKDWSTSDFVHEARYSNLPAGDFEFWAKASNSDGIWSEPSLVYSFTILPVWWQTKLAYVSYIIVFIGLILIYNKIRLSRLAAVTEARKLKEIDDFKNQFFTNITHEFRTPLTVITGISERIETEDGLVIRRNAEQLLALINQILELSKIESNSAKLNPESFELISYLKYLQQSFISLAAEKNLTLDFDSNAEEINCFIDKTKLALIIQNLIVNAIKFTSKDGKVELKTKQTGGSIEISVIDSGVGIESSELPFIFNRFYQANNQQQNSAGTGIGLALSKELTVLLNGTIVVDSKPGEGTVFKVTLPYVHQNINVSQPDKLEVVRAENILTPIDAEENKLTVLLIEDNPDVANLVKTILSPRFNVLFGTNGRVGVQIAIDEVPDIIVSDVMMPEMNGLDATQILKADQRTSHIPIILLTAKVDLDSRLTGLEYGADIYLAKPFHSKELLLNIDNLIRLRNALTSRYATRESLVEEAVTTNPEDQFVLKLQNLIYDKLSDDSYGIEEVCRDIGVSRTQLHRKLKALTGKSTSIYIRDLRLAEGKKMLMQNSLTVAEVAYAVGFSDPNYFTRLFSEKFGHPPTQERKN